METSEEERGIYIYPSIYLFVTDDDIYLTMILFNFFLELPTRSNREDQTTYLDLLICCSVRKNCTRCNIISCT